MAPPYSALLLHLWADKYGLRHVPATGRYRGIIDGMCLDAHEFSGELFLHCFSPSVALVGEIANDFAGFQHFATTGFSTKALHGVLESGKLDDRSCTLRLTSDQLSSTNPEVLAEIPTLLAADFAEHGAMKETLACAGCASSEPQHVVLLGSHYQAVCDQCFNRFQESAAWTPDDAPIVEAPVNLTMMTVATAISSVLLGLIWGLIQYHATELSYWMLVMIPMFGVFVHARIILRFSEGLRPIVVRTIYVSSLVWILVGNVIGLGGALAKQGIAATWTQVIWIYFNVHLPLDWESEGWYFIGGVVGIYITLRNLKPESYRQVARTM